MRFIHTADWHLGNQLHDIDRREEALSFFTWLKQQIVEKQAQALIVAGDVFDTANPPVEARHLYYRFLASLADTPCRTVVIVGGNHDSAVLLDAAKELLEVLNVHVVGSICNMQPSDLVFELQDASQNTCGICMAVPYVREVELRNFLADESAASPENAADAKVPDADLYNVAYKALYARVYKEAERLRGTRPLPIVATGHLYAAQLDGRLSNAASNTKHDDGMKVLDVLGTLGNVPPDVFPPADYVALGHIHYATMVAKNPGVRYSGSPFVMGFDDSFVPHYVLCVDVAPHAENGDEASLSVEKLETPQAAVYRRLSGTLPELKLELEKLSALPGTVGSETAKPVFLELYYQRALGVNAPEFLEDAIRALPDHIRVVSWKVQEQENAAFAGGFAGFDAAEVRNLDDKKVFTQLILSKSGLAPESAEAKAALETFLPLFLKVAAEV